jgi:hypothetical protein
VGSSHDFVAETADAGGAGRPADEADAELATDLGPDTEDPGTPSGAADSASAPDGASATSEPELGETDADEVFENADSDPLDQRLEEE